MTELLWSVLFVAQVAAFGWAVYVFWQTNEDRWTVYCRLRVQNMLNLEAIDCFTSKSYAFRHGFARFFRVNPIHVYPRVVQILIRSSTTSEDVWH